MERLKITRFGGKFIPSQKEYNDLKSLIEQCDDLYPGIENWYKKKVISGLKEHERNAYIIYENDVPVGASIIKYGNDAKICSLRLLPEAENKGYGKIFFALIARDLRNKSDIIHFTIPENIWRDKQYFFESYGFNEIGPSNDQYRLFDKELYCRGNYTNLWQKVRRTLPQSLSAITLNDINFDFDLVISVQPIYANSIFEGRKRVEIRRRFSSKWKNSKALVYSSAPENSFIGSFKISNVEYLHPSEIWENHNDSIGCNKDEYDKYTSGLDKVYAIFIDDCKKFKAPMLKSSLNAIIDSEIKVPQSHKLFNKDEIIKEAISIGTLMQSTL